MIFFNRLRTILRVSVLFQIMAFLFVSCCSFPIFFDKSKCSSDKTGWSYNDRNYGKYSVNTDYELPPTGPGLVLIEGGTSLMGNLEQDVFFDWDNVPRRVSLNSYYMDESEVSNVNYREYLNWLQKIYVDYPNVYLNALPDTLVWLAPFTYNEPFAYSYFRHPAFANYPVVGVSWYQAIEYCKWRTDRVNEHILLKNGVIKHKPDQANDNSFNTQAYMLGLYEVENGKRSIKDIESEDKKAKRTARFEDGLLLPDYRLPTEAEWEYAANAIKVDSKESAGLNKTNKRTYTWDGDYVRNSEEKKQGEMLANFKMGKGDYMGVAGALNDKYSETAPVKSGDFPPNDFGLHHMAGNVSEWVYDVYRAMSSIDVSDANPFRGNQFMVLAQAEDGSYLDKDSLGRMRKRPISDAELANRTNIRKSDYRDFRDGDAQTSIDWEILDGAEQEEVNNTVYNYGKTSLINNETKVIKGGSWKDIAYYLQTGVRRYAHASTATDWIGFRSAMSRVGPPLGEGKEIKKGSPKKGVLGFIFK